MKKKLLAKLSNLFGIAGILIWLRRLFKKEIVILAYHRILDTDKEIEYLFDENLISADSDTFQWQVEFLKKHYDVISFEELSERLSGRKKITGKELLITFDDGFSDNYSNAFRILNSVDIPATFYISTSYMNSKKTFWFNEVVHSIKTAENLSFTLNGDRYNFHLTQENRKKSIDIVLNQLKKISNAERIEAIESLYRDLEFNADNIPASERPMTWKNISEMASNNMEIGSHSMSHPILSKLTDTEMEYEIVNSKQTIESVTGKKCRSIAYPVGGHDTFTDKVQQASKLAGYEFGLSYISGNNQVEKLNTYSLNRLHIERYTNHEEFKLMLYLPEIYQKR